MVVRHCRIAARIRRARLGNVLDPIGASVRVTSFRPALRGAGAEGGSHQL